MIGIIKRILKTRTKKNTSNQNVNPINIIFFFDSLVVTKKKYTDINQLWSEFPTLKFIKGFKTLEEMTKYIVDELDDLEEKEIYKLKGFQEPTSEELVKLDYKRHIKSLRVMADYSSSGIWIIEQAGPFKHSMANYSDLGISEKLSNAFEKWITEYDKALEGKLDKQLFDKTGRDLALDLKKELPDVQVFYYHENRDLGEEEV